MPGSFFFCTWMNEEGTSKFMCQEAGHRCYFRLMSLSSQAIPGSIKEKHILPEKALERASLPKQNWGDGTKSGHRQDNSSRLQGQSLCLAFSSLPPLSCQPHDESLPCPSWPGCRTHCWKGQSHCKQDMALPPVIFNSRTYPKSALTPKLPRSQQSLLFHNGFGEGSSRGLLTKFSEKHVQKQRRDWTEKEEC